MQPKSTSFALMPLIRPKELRMLKTKTGDDLWSLLVIADDQQRIGIPPMSPYYG
jgi:hypothetical protein